jgi:hypothetical protein
LADDGAADADLGLLSVELKMQALEGDRLADPEAAGREELEQRTVALGRHSQDGGELLAAEDLDLVRVGWDLLAVGQGEALGGVVADQALSLRRGQRGAQRRRDIGDRSVAEAPALLLLVGEPVQEPREVEGGELGQLQLAREVGMGVGGDQAAVFVAGVLPEATTALAAVALNPLVQIAEEGDRRALLQLAAVAIGLALALDPPRFPIGAGVALSLAPRATEDADVADRLALAIHALEDARRLRLPQPPLVAATWDGLGGRRILGNAHEPQTS